MTNLSYPIINVTNLTFQYAQSKCVDSTGRVSVECISRDICPQISKYIPSMGLKIIIGYVVISWLLWWFMKWGYKLIDYSEYDPKSLVWGIVGDLRELNTRIYWDSFVRDKLGKLCLGFVIVITYLYWRGV